MDRSRSLVLIGILCALVATAFIVIAVATNEWIVIKVSGEKIFSLGLWKYCVLDRCFGDVSITPTVLALATLALVLISILVLALVNIRNSTPPSLSVIPIVFFFISSILLLATVVVFWPELPQRSYETAIKDIMDGAKSIAPPLKTKQDIVSVGTNPFAGLGSDLSSVNMEQLESALNTIRDSLSINHGFSSGLLISALPLLIICLIVSTYIAAFRKAESIFSGHDYERPHHTKY